MYDKLNLWSLVLAFATAIGAFGGFPEPPKAFAWFTQMKIFQWLVVFVLIYQGGGSQDPLFSIAVTGAVFVLYTVVRFFEAKDKEKDE